MMNAHSAMESRLRRRVDQYLETGQLMAAQSALESFVQRFPDTWGARLDLADILIKRGQLRNSESQLLHILQQKPQQPDTYLELVHRFYGSGNIVAARQCLEKSEESEGPTSDLAAAQAHLRWMLGEIAAAKARIEYAISLGVDTPDEHYLHASLLQFVGSIDEAENILGRCIQRWPAFGGAAMALAKLKKQTVASNHVDSLRHVLARIPEESRVASDRLIRAEFQAALFKELDDLSQYEVAWQSLSACNQVMHDLNPYDDRSEEALVDALINESLSERSTNVTSDSDAPGPTPIFIVGMPRSGTTLLDRMLSSHSEVASAGEINDMLKQVHWLADVPLTDTQSTVRAIHDLSRRDLGVLGSRYLEQTQWRAQGRRYYIDKLPTNIQWVSVIRRALPHARIIHVTREPMDLCFSNFKAMFGNASAYSYDMESLAHYHRQYQRLVSHWHAAMPGAMLDIAYEDLVQHPAATISLALKHCQLEFEDNCVHPERNDAPVATPSSAQVREAIHARALGQWKHYESHLQPLRDALT